MQTVTLTISVPDEMATLSEKDRAAYLADINRFATAAAKARTNAQQDEAEAGLFTDADAEALREALADIAAGEKPKSEAASFAKVAARVGLQNTTL